MRQDPWYWMVYTALRGDQNSNPVSYPYYTKFQRKDDHTSFRHIDVNVSDLVHHRRGWYQIQGSLSLDDEVVGDCTQILPGMHRHIEAWTADLEGRGLKDTGLIHTIDDRWFTASDSEKYSTTWTDVPCQRLQVRITQPHIPHGPRGPATRVRRTMLPWFVAVQPDHHHLEIVEAGTWEDLAAAHRNLVPGPRSPSGHPNRYGKVPNAFPAAVPLTGLGALSDALVCRIKHTNPLVIREKQALLSGTSETRNNIINAWRHRAMTLFADAYIVVRQAEKECYGEKSFWYRREKGMNTVPPPYDANPDNEPTDDAGDADSSVEGHATGH